MCIARIVLVASLSAIAAAKCIPIEQAQSKIGDHACVSGRVLKIGDSRGAQFLDFCDDHRKCPFSAVVFDRDLRDVGDIRDLAGKNVEIHGTITAYEGQPQIILKHARQLHGVVRLPPVPKEYDVERRGRYSPGKFKTPKGKRRATSPKRQKGLGEQTEEQE